MLKLASGFLGSGKDNTDAVQQLIAGLQGDLREGVRV